MPAPGTANQPTSVPPGTSQSPTLSRINELLRADQIVTENRPAFVPPSTVTDPVTGKVSPVRQPPNPLDNKQAPAIESPAQTPVAPPSREPAPAVVAAGEAKPQSAGAAATPYDLSKMDLDETKAARSTAEWDFLMQTPRKGDATEYIPGVLPTRSEIELSAPKSIEAKLLRQEFREPYSDAEQAKMEIAHKTYDDVAGTPT